MDKESLELLIQDKSPDVRVKATLLWNGVTKCAKAYQESPTKSALGDWKSAETALEEFVAVVSGGGDSTPNLPNILAVVDFLQAAGWKVKKSSAYQHHKEGKIKSKKDGTFRVQDAEKYAVTYLKRLDTGTMAAGEADKLQQEKLQAETDKMKAQARHWQVRAQVIEGNYVEKSLFEGELARRASVFKNDLENFCRSQAPEIIHRVSGDVALIPDLIEFLLEQTESFLDRYTEEKEFKVPVVTITGESIEEAEEE